MSQVVHDLVALKQDLANQEPTVREKTAAAAFLAQFYNGVENILKRIHHNFGVPLPQGNTWHVELFQRFCPPGHKPLPILFQEPFASNLAPYRRFRHVVFHGYGFQLDWHRMVEGIETIQPVFDEFKIAISKFSGSL
jgi:hypothetical protein